MKVLQHQPGIPETVNGKILIPEFDPEHLRRAEICLIGYAQAEIFGELLRSLTSQQTYPLPSPDYSPFWMVKE